MQIATPAFANPYEVCMPLVDKAVSTNYRVERGAAKIVARDAIKKFKETKNTADQSSNGNLGVDLFDAVSINAGNSDAGSHTSQIVEKYARDFSLDLSDDDYLFLLTSVENPEVARAARDCISSIGQNQGAVRYFVSDVQADEFSITYYYTPQNGTDPEYLLVTNLSITGGAKAISPFIVGQGTHLEKFAGYTQQFRRTREDQSAVVQLDISDRQTVPVKIEAVKKYDPLPVGIVVASPLAWGQFAALSGDSPAFDARKSKWAPCDGRSVAGSLLSTGGEGRAPDLRGVFVRGLNDFAAGSVPPVATDRADPEAGRRAGDYQADELKAHSHKLGYKPWGLKNGNGAVNLEVGSPNIQTESAGGAETRPKNIALYYYIKIN